MNRLKSLIVGISFLCVAIARAAEIEIPIAHLQDAQMTNGYRNALITDLKGYAKVGSVTVKSQMLLRSLPAEGIVENGKQYLRVNMIGQGKFDNEENHYSGYTLVNPESLQPVKTVMADGEVTLYRMVKDYPAMMRVGAKELISKSDSFDSKSLKVPSYRTYEVLTLERVNGETDLYELCETDYEYGKDSGYKKVQSESSSCFIIDRQGELKGYAMLMVNAKSRATYQGTIYAE